MAETSPSQYWATLPAQDMAREAWAKVVAYYDFARTSPFFARISRAHRATFGESGRDGVTWELQRDGKQGELVRFQSGDYRNNGEHRVTIATQQKPAWQPVATNSDFTSMAMASVVSGVMDYYWRDRRVGRLLRQALKDIQWAGEGFILGLWDANQGQTIAADPETGEEVKDGDLRFLVPTIYDVVRDPYASSWDSLKWRMVREFVSKWDLAAQYPEHAEQILALRSGQHDPVRRLSATPAKSDEVPIFHLFHDKSPAVPDGLYAVIASDELVLMPPGPLPYRGKPLVRMAEDETRGAPFGYCALWDSLGPLEAADKLQSAIVTNQMAHAVNKIVTTKGSGINRKDLGQALAVIEVNSMDQKPEVLQLSKTEPQVFQYEAELRARAQRLANLNDVAVGAISESIKSGAHAALYDAIALRGANALQEAYFAGAEDIGTFVLLALADYAGDSERTARIVGEQNRPLLFTFTGSDLAGFERVTIEATHDATKTVLGKQAVADALLEKGVLGDDTISRRYLAIVKTGEAEQMTEAPMAHFLRQKRDKEMLAKGIGPVPRQPVVDPLTGMPAVGPDGKPMMQPGIPEPGREYLVILETDPHWLDIPEYLSVLSSPEARANPAVAQAVTEAVLQKLDAWRNMDPDLLALLGGPPPPSMTGMVGPPAPGGGSSTPPPRGGESSGTQPPPGAEQPSLPSMPSNPTSGQPHDPTATGAIA